jgi:hypothetical protein
MKICFKCGENKNLSEFYKHNRMGDGYLGKCKLCTKKDVSKNRGENIDHYRKYDRDRGNRQTPEYFKKLKALYPNQYKSQTMVGNAIRDGKLFKKPCEVCSLTESIHAHHDDYLEPLNVRWLCAAHHKQWHRDNGEGLNR